MRIIATAPDTGRKWKLEPLENGLCFQLFASPKKGAKNPRTGEATKAEWVFTGKYPSDVAAGIKCMINGMLSDPDGTASIECDPKYLVKTIKKTIDDYIHQVIASVVIEATDLEEEAIATITEALSK